MKVILKVDVKGTGKKGETVEVSDGYARNYLLPRNFAIEASAGALRSLQEEKNAQMKRQERIVQNLQALRDRLDSQTITVKAKSGENGRLFGSITNKDVAEAITKFLGTQFDRKIVDMPTPIKSLGTYPVTLKFGHNISGIVNVQITEG